MTVDSVSGEIVGSASRVEIDHPKGRPGKRVRLFIDPDEKLTKESLDVETDMNKIIEKAQRGVPVNVSTREPFYGDVSQIPDYQGAMNVIIKVEKDFNSLSSKIRERFDNDPQKMLAFLMDPKNEDEARSLGMLKPKPVEPVKPVVPPAT